MTNTTSRVLIVDDMPLNRIVLSSLLGSQGIVSDQVESGRECINACEKTDYDLILLDHRMPELDGIDTLMELKKLFEKTGRVVPVVCHTTEEGRKNINLYKAAGFVDVLIKPVDPKELFDVLMEHLSDVSAPAEPSDGPSFDFLKAAENLTDENKRDENAKAEAAKLPMWLKIVPGIDLLSGISNCGSAQDYVDALYIFYSSIDEKSEEIHDFLEDEDWTMYALRIHSLKSMARIVGAKKLGETAAMLEDASRSGLYERVKKETPGFLSAYREFGSLLSQIADDEDLMNLEDVDVPVAEPAAEKKDTSRSVLYIQNGRNMVRKGIENNLTQAGFNVISIPDEPDRIIMHRDEADIVIYYPITDENSHISLTMNLLGEICQDDAKIFCLAGDTDEVEKAMQSNGSHRVSKTYERPVDIDAFIKDMGYYSELEAEYHRRKSVFVVDDDPGYLSVIEHWLSSDYSVSCFTNGEDALGGLRTVTPDLILLDYEMPMMDGCMLMKSIRNSFPDRKIPIIFLTGKNDRDLVFQVLEYKPDGYLLKTSSKDNLLDAIKRFFAETLLKQSMFPV